MIENLLIWNAIKGLQKRVEELEKRLDKPDREDEVFPESGCDEYGSLD